LNYTRKTKIGSITSGIFYRRIEDEITRVIFTNPENPNKQVLSLIILKTTMLTVLKYPVI
jgi:hypothetical protein